MVKGRHPYFDSVPCLFLAENFTEVPTEGSWMTSDIFTPEVLYSSVIQNLEYNLPILLRTLYLSGPLTKRLSETPFLHHSGSNVAGTFG